MTDVGSASPFGLYIHWPFCSAKCPYCDFNSHVSAEIDESRWNRAFLSEIARIREETGRRVLSTVFFGGGTPSLMSPELVGSILNAVRQAWPAANDLEVTLEANPTSVEAARFRGYRDAGVNRVSLGIQSLRDPDLRRLGRRHTAAEALAALDVANGVFDRASFDLIYARQDQTPAAWRDELAEALSLAGEHVSLYQLTIESGTAFGERAARGTLAGLPDEDRALALFEITQELTEAAGLTAYEISNHARPGAESRHNLIYWTGGDWAGVGPGAHGRLTLGAERVATETALRPADWLRRVEEGGTGETLRTSLDRREIAEEALMMGLRLSRGMPLQALETAAFPEQIEINIRYLIEDGLLEMGTDYIGLTARGRPLLDAVLRAILA